MIYQLSPEYSVRALAESDLDGPYPSWFEDQDVTLHSSHGKFFRTLEYFREYIRNQYKDDRVVWAISHVDDGHIGNIALQEISMLNRTAELAILLGDKRHWGLGVGRLAGKQLLAHAFEKLNLERVYCGTAATNAGMKRLAESLGMTLEGTRRAHLFLGGRRVDVLDYGILRAEFGKAK